jgi:hypothetical protein
MNDLIERYRPVATTAAQMREAADCMEVQQRELNAAHARITQLEQALRELVRLKDLKERRDALYIKCKVAHDITAAETEELNRLTSEYARCKPLAWQAARQALEHKEK